MINFQLTSLFHMSSVMQVVSDRNFHSRKKINYIQNYFPKIRLKKYLQHQ